MRAVLSGRVLAAVVFVLTVGQLLVGAFVPALDQFAGKAFGARLLVYPVLMLVMPALYAWSRRRRAGREPLPWNAFLLLMVPFLIDVTGNTFDLYDAVVWWDDANHLVNWALLCGGAGWLMLRALPGLPAWAAVVLVTGTGSLLAVAWELAEWFTFIRFGTELATAYQDTLFDEVLGTLGALVAGVLLAIRRRQCSSAARPAT